jgi:uncharacterized protein involved in outer membrane biogenesis
MRADSIVRRGLKLSAAALAALILMAAALVAALDAGYFRGPVIRMLAARSGRQIQVQGSLEIRLFSRNPQVIAQRVSIGNPPWMPPGTTAEIGKLSLTIECPWFGHALRIDSLEMQEATLNLVRDPAGRANWQLTDPDKGAEAGLPIIRSLSMPNAHVVLDDALRHLQFEGAVSAQGVHGAKELQLLRIDGMGRLNGRPATFEILGDPLAVADHHRPYHFTFAERSSGSQLSGRGFLLRPFGFDQLDTTFDATGADLKDLYFLTGVTLVNTGNYRLTGKLARRGSHSKFSDLVAASGQSDMRGTVSIDTSSGRPKIDADIESQLLRLSDLGARAAGREPKPAPAKPLLLSDATLSPYAVRHGDGVVNFQASRVDVAHVSLHAVSAKVTIDHGVLTMSPLLADVLGGKLRAQLTLDATTDVPRANLDLTISDLQLAQIGRKGTGPPPIEGPLQARVTVTGRGSSIHQVAATANGTLVAVLPRGAIRDAFAELTGIDLRGLGLLLTKSKQEAAVRCGVASFAAHEGTLTAQTLVMDTDPVLIDGSGQIHLDSEALEMTLRGHPKGARLFRLNLPLDLRGSLARPSIEIGARTSGQAAQAALGGVLTPVAAVLSFVDPKLSKNADCAALLAAAKAGDAHVH